MRTDAPNFPRPDSFDSQVVVYLTPGCPFCTMARRLLNTRGIVHEVVDVSGNSAARSWLLQASGQRTVPQIFIRQQSIGGFDELRSLDYSGELGSLVNPPRSPGT